MCNKLQVDFFRIYKSATRLYSKYLLIEGCNFVTSKESLQANCIALVVIGSVPLDNSCHVATPCFFVGISKTKMFLKRYGYIKVQLSFCYDTKQFTKVQYLMLYEAMDWKIVIKGESFCQ